MKRLAGLIGLLVVAVLIVVILLVQLRAPSHIGDWRAGHDRLPQAEVNGDRVAVRNLRNFTYRPDGTVQQARFEDRTYDLSKLESLWYGLSHFGSYGLAHSFVSFGFADGVYLALSVEARLEKGQAYNPWLGLLRAYELIYVAADERDVIGLRTHIRGETVYLYEIRVPAKLMKQLLLIMLATMNEIHDTPRFYNTLVDNCTTNILQHAEGLTRWDLYTDYRVILPGFSDGLAYELGAIADDLPFEETRERARIDANRSGVDDASFSRLIRNHP